MKRRARAVLGPLSMVGLGGALGMACAFIDRFPDVAPDPPGSSGASGGSGGGASSASGHGGASSTGSSNNGSGGSGGAVMCTPATQVPCYDGPPGTEGKGLCVGGMKTCDKSGMAYGPCVGQVLPTFQSCTSMTDTNCDGVLCTGAYGGDKGLSSAGDQQGLAIAVTKGAAVIAGFGTGSVDLGNHPTSDLGDAKTPDAFLASFDGGLGPRFSHRFSDSEGRGVAFSASDGDVVLVGSALGDVDFGGGLLPSSNPVGRDVFAARFTAAGVHRSSARFGDAPADQIAAAVAVGGDGDAVMTGAMAGVLDCKNGTTLTSKGGADALVAKLGPDSQIMWCKSYGDGADQRGTAVAIRPSGNIVVVGWFSGVIDFGGGALTSAGTIDMFVAELDPSGGHVFSKSFGGSGAAKATGVALDGNGEIVIAGFFTEQLKITAPLKLNTTGPSDENVFVLRLDATGKPLWAKSFGDALNQEALGMAVDAEGNIVLTGKFGGTLNMGAPSPPVSAGGNDAFAAKLDASGKGLWARGFGDGAEQSGNAVAVDGLGGVWLTGQFAGSIDFGGGAVPGGGGNDVFLARLTP